MKRVISASLVLATCCALQAAPISTDATRHAATNFWNTYRPEGVKAITESDAQKYECSSLSHLHIYAVGNEGFVVMSAEDAVRPVLAYSFNAPLAADGLNSSMLYWLQGYETQIADVAANGTEADEQTAEQWNRLLTATPPAEPLTITAVPQMLTCTWDQGRPYNNLCPFDSTYNERTVVGCTATAMAQIMYYWKYPTFGNGSHEYHHWRHGNIGLDFGQTTYLWYNMVDDISYGGTQRAIRAIAGLSYHCGVSVDMNYGPSSTGGSGAYVISGGYDHACSEVAFRDYFKYNPDLHGEERANFDDSVWVEMINADMENGRPILYTGYDSAAGHAFVLDGADIEGRYHFNWGWGGYGNGFYYIDNLNPGGSGIGGNSSYTFNLWQQAIFNMYPLEEHFDTVEITINTCNRTSTYPFYEHEIKTVNDTMYLAHLDTMFHVIMNVEPKSYAYFSPNGAEGQRSTVTFCINEGITMPECTFSYQDLVFCGWGTNSEGSGNIYQPGQLVNTNHNIVFYAIWRDSVTAANMAGIFDTPESVELTIGPNPATSEISVFTDQQIVDLKLFDQVGHAIHTTINMSAASAKIDLTGLQKGMYTIQVRTESGVCNRRIVKQ